jgi:hypothetical protein
LIHNRIDQSHLTHPHLDFGIRYLTTFIENVPRLPVPPKGILGISNLILQNVPRGTFQGWNILDTQIHFGYKTSISVRPSPLGRPGGASSLPQSPRSHAVAYRGGGLPSPTPTQPMMIQINFQKRST